VASQTLFTRSGAGWGLLPLPVGSSRLVPMIRSALSVLLVLALAGCGFHLRDKLALPADTPPVQVMSTTPYSELVTILERNLRNAGASVAPRPERNAPASGATTPEAKVARLDILSERWGDLPIAIDEQGRAQEFSLRYATIFTFRLADGRELVPQQVVELSRDYVSPPEDATGTSTEREILADELRREMAASILRRIDSVVRAALAREAALPAAPAEAAPEVEQAPVPTTAPKTP
jgi:LPS-assembly lipoprotein